MKNKARMMYLLPVLLLCLLFSACSSSEEDGERSIGTAVKGAGNGKWRDSDLIGSVEEGEEIRLQDDFAAAAKQKWILSGEAAEGGVSAIPDIVLEKKEALLRNGAFSGKAWEELKKYADLAADWEYRNAQGIEPLKSYIDSIEAISSVPEYYDWICDTERNPLGIAPLRVLGVMRSQAAPLEYITYLDGPDYVLKNPETGDTDFYYSLTNAGLERKEIVDQKIGYLLERLGYAQEDIRRIQSENYKMEKLLLANSGETEGDEEEEDYTFQRGQIADLAGEYPAIRFLEAWGYSTSDRFGTDEVYLKKLAKTCTEENLSRLKSMLIVQYLLASGDALDQEAYEKMRALEVSRLEKEKPDTDDALTKEREILFDTYIGNSALSGAMDYFYVEQYTDPDAYGELEKMAKDIISACGTMFLENEWLSEEGKAACIEKLGSLSVHVVYQDYDSMDYSGLDIVSKEDGGSFLEADFAEKRFLGRVYGARSMESYDREKWDPFDASISTTITNAMYMPSTNGIYILAGILEAPVYWDGMTEEELLSGIGSIVGHEITHGFDNTGVQYDKDGLQNPWLPVEDQLSFNDRNDDVSAYYTMIEPYAASGLYDGGNVSGEATADMGGIKAGLILARGIEDFDYDLYFRHYASIWAVQYDFEVEEWYFKNDEHPLNFLRTNVGLQQYDEFGKTYGIQPGDGMYLETDKRIAVW